MDAILPETRTRPLELRLARVLDAPRRLVFDMWTRPEHLARWWGPRGATLRGCGLEVRPGGAWWIRIAMPEGEELRVSGTFFEVAPPERLVFSWAWDDAEGNPGPETLVTVTFAETEGWTTLALHQAVFESEHDRNCHAEGWGQGLDRLVQAASDV